MPGGAFQYGLTASFCCAGPLIWCGFYYLSAQQITSTQGHGAISLGQGVLSICALDVANYYYYRCSCPYIFALREEILLMFIGKMPLHIAGFSKCIWECISISRMDFVLSAAIFKMHLKCISFADGILFCNYIYLQGQGPLWYSNSTCIYAYISGLWCRDSGLFYQLMIGILLCFSK